MSAPPGPREVTLGYKHGIKRIAEKKYRVVYDIPATDGKKRQQKRETLVGVTKKEAEAIRAKRIEEIANGQYVKADDMTVTTLFERFMDQKRLKGLSPTTLRRYQNIFDCHLKTAFGDSKVKTLRPPDLISQYNQMFEHRRNNRKISARTIHHVHELLRNGLGYAKRMEWVHRNVAELVANDDLPKVVTPPPKALKQGQLKKVLDEAKNPTSRAKKRGYLSAQPWFYPSVVFVSHTGCRRGEAAALRWPDLDFEEKEAVIFANFTEKLEYKLVKEDRRKRVALDDDLIAVLKAHKKVQDEEKRFLGDAYQDGGFVFANADGSPIRPWNFGRAVRDLIIRTGVTGVTLHNLRDSHASLLLQEGVPLEVVSKRLGHAEIGITAKRYVDVFRERDTAAAKAFGNLMRRDKNVTNQAS